MRGEVDGVGEVGGQKLVGLVFRPSAVGRQLGELIGAGGESLVVAVAMVLVSQADGKSLFEWIWQMITG